MFHQLSKAAQIKQAITVTAGAAAATDITGTTIDTANFRGCMFVVQLGAIVSGAVTSLKVQHGDASNMSDAADIEGSSQTIADTDDEKTVYVDVAQLTKRYIRLYVDRATQNATLSANAILYNARDNPAVQASPVIGEAMANPVSGTA